jgi:pimeloyl-ACP methyl ester carboxylesterase
VAGTRPPPAPARGRSLHAPARDPIALPAVAQRLAAEIPGARLTWLDDLGHYPMLEDPERWSAAVLRFLAELS